MDGYDVAAALRDGVADRRAAWRFIRTFAAAWAEPLRDNDGVDPQELGAAQKRLGIPLPAALREAYLLFGRRDDLTSNQDWLVAPNGLAVDRDVLVFRHENQHAASWGIPVAAAADPDPPVLVEHDAGWQPFLDRVSLACVEMVLSETLFAPGDWDNAAEVPAELIELVEKNYRRVNFPEYPSWADPADPIRWYSAPGELLRMDGEGEWAWLYVRGRTAKDRERIEQAVPARWTIRHS
ncbi:hypothetical protein [Micromonospora sp. NPDC005806]|uniref:hypothetical protein n=1 Tax=Micromonospora sp. NPDC005806 TaxID=3364234 RepID=UPI00367AB509